MSTLRIEKLDGSDFRRAVALGVTWLEHHRDTINALNVFPVPDGDTGTNMLLTMRAGLEARDNRPGSDLDPMGQTLSRGLFLGARGNSGVILSQFFKGFCDALSGLKDCTAQDLATAFSHGTEAAYQAVGQPVEGTMLSVLRAAAEGVQQAQANQNAGIEVVWKAAFGSARSALALTPSQLPVLAEAGVVDAGGMGLVAILGGIYAYFSSEQIDLDDLGVPTGLTELPTLNQSFIDVSHHSQWGYCTQFLIAGKALEVEEIKHGLGLVSESVVVIGDAQQVRVHVHAEDPGPALSYGVSLGQLSQVQIENMSQQNRQWHSAGNPAPVVDAPPVAVVAVAPGEGFRKLFRDCGCAEIIDGGQTMNPSVAQIRDAAEASGAKDVIFLANNPNIVAAARHAAGEVHEQFRLHVVPTLSAPQGVAAMLAYNSEQSLEHNLRAMEASREGVTTVEVTRSVRDSMIGGLPVTKGQYITLINGDIVLAGDSAETALLQSLERTGMADDPVIALYWGEGSSEEAAGDLAGRIRSRWPGVQVDVVYGGQPHYPYLASVE